MVLCVGVLLMLACEMVRWAVDKLHAAGILVMNMIGAPKHVKYALAAGVDIICAQGGEGGGSFLRIRSAVPMSTTCNVQSACSVAATAYFHRQSDCRINALQANGSAEFNSILQSPAEGPAWGPACMNG